MSETLPPIDFYRLMRERHRAFGEPFTIGVDWAARPAGADCKAAPCSHCGACAVCQDFHGTSYGGCTDETCPLLQPTPSSGESR